MRALDVLHIPAVAISVMITVGCAAKQSPEATEALQSADAAPSSDVVSTTPAPEASENPAAPTKPTPVIDDGLRLPDMLALPSERDLRKPASPPPVPAGGGVTARPPVSD